jgi:hypothetical protein
VRTLEEVGEADGWRCWLCDDPVDPAMSVNDPRGPSLDARVTKAKAKSKGAPTVRLAHRACNTGKGANVRPIPWPDDLFLIDPSPIIASVERLERKGGREVMARCVDRRDAEAAATWLVDRISRLEPSLSVTVDIEPGGGQHLLILQA